MANIQHLPGRRYAVRTPLPRTPGVATMAAYALFLCAFGFTAAVVLGLVP